MNLLKSVKLGKLTKKMIIAVTAVIIVFLSASALMEAVVPKYEEVNELRYSFKSTGDIDYRVYLKPNIMYGTDYLEKGRYYILKYIDYIHMDFLYDFTGYVPVPVKVDYSVKATLQGLHGNKDEILWSKDYDLIESDQIEVTDEKVKLQIPAMIQLDDFNKIKDALFNDSEINSRVVLNIIFNIRTTAYTDEGNILSVLTPKMTIPVGSSVFKIEGQTESKDERKIEKKKQVIIPVNITKIIVFAFLSLLLTLVVIFIYKIEESEAPDPFDSRLADIFKEYGERLAGMEHTISHQFSDVISVNSVEDIIKIADEVGQPVFYYKVNQATERKIEFYVFDYRRTYYMVIFGEIKPEVFKPEQEEV